MTQRPSQGSQWYELLAVGVQWLAVTGILDRLTEAKRQARIVASHLVEAAVEIGAVKREDVPPDPGVLPMLRVILAHWVNLAGEAVRGVKQ